MPSGVEQTYDEARRVLSVGASNASALLCRKLLLQVAVDKGLATERDSFQQCVKSIAESSLDSADEDWLDCIRYFGNLATHRVDAFPIEVAQIGLVYSELLLRRAYSAKPIP